MTEPTHWARGPGPWQEAAPTPCPPYRRPRSRGCGLSPHTGPATVYQMHRHHLPLNSQWTCYHPPSWRRSNTSPRGPLGPLAAELHPEAGGLCLHHHRTGEAPPPKPHPCPAPHSRGNRAGRGRTAHTLARPSPSLPWVQAADSLSAAGQLSGGTGPLRLASSMQTLCTGARPAWAVRPPEDTL